MHSGLVRALVPVSLCLGLGLPAKVGHQPSDIVVIGKITDSPHGRALANAQVLVQGTSISARSDTGGRYRLSVPLSATKERELSLMARHIGYAPSTRTIRPATDSITVDFALAPASMQLQSVVVTGTAAEYRKRSLGNSVTSVDAASASSPPPASIEVKVFRGVAVAPTVRKDERATRVPGNADPAFNTEGYDVINENPFLSTASAPRSTFSIDVDRASYSNV